MFPSLVTMNGTLTKQSELAAANAYIPVGDDDTTYALIHPATLQPFGSDTHSHSGIPYCPRARCSTWDHVHNVDPEHPGVIRIFDTEAEVFEALCEGLKVYAPSH